MQSLRQYIETNELTPDEAAALERRSVDHYVAQSDAFTKFVMWLFLPRFFRRVRSLARGRIVWTER